MKWVRVHLHPRALQDQAPKPEQKLGKRRTWKWWDVHHLVGFHLSFEIDDALFELLPPFHRTGTGQKNSEGSQERYIHAHSFKCCRHVF